MESLTNQGALNRLQLTQLAETQKHKRQTAETWTADRQEPRRRGLLTRRQRYACFCYNMLG